MLPFEPPFEALPSDSQEPSDPNCRKAAVALGELVDGLPRDSELGRDLVDRQPRDVLPPRLTHRVDALATARCPFPPEWTSRTWAKCQESMRIIPFPGPFPGPFPCPFPRPFLTRSARVLRALTDRSTHRRRPGIDTGGRICRGPSEARASSRSGPSHRSTCRLHAARPGRGELPASARRPRRGEPRVPSPRSLKAPRRRSPARSRAGLTIDHLRPGNGLLHALTRPACAARADALRTVEAAGDARTPPARARSAEDAAYTAPPPSRARPAAANRRNPRTMLRRRATSSKSCRPAP